jgi:hypothetical protein
LVGKACSWFLGITTYFLERARLRDSDAIHVFNRVSVLLLQRLALAISSLGHGTVDEPNHLLGEIALLANDYVTGSALRQVEKQDKVDYVTLMIEMLPTWDITNGPDLAYGLTRAYRILQVHLPGDDAVVVELRNKADARFQQRNVRWTCHRQCASCRSV